MTDTIGLSAKRFIERFKREVGVMSKRYCPIRRFQRALTLSDHDRRVDWTRVAMDCGYFDQAHFIHETSESEPEDKPYGHRNAGVIDQNGITWWIGAPVR